jgi:hypothetical protein
LAPKAFDLLLGGGTNIGGSHNRTQTPRRRNGLKACDADAHNEHLSRCDRARCRHHHRQDAAIGLRRFDHSAVTGQIGLRRQGVHDLCAGDSRHELHGKGARALGGQSLDHRAVIIGVHQGDHDRTGLEGRDLCIRGPAHLEDNIRR